MEGSVGEPDGELSGARVELQSPSTFVGSVVVVAAQGEEVVEVRLAEVCDRLGDSSRAVRSTIEQALRTAAERNVPLVLDYGEQLLQLNQASKAHAMLLDLMNNVPPTPEQVRLIDRAASMAEENAEAYYYLSEYRLMTGDLVGGVNYLRQALVSEGRRRLQTGEADAATDLDLTQQAVGLADGQEGVAGLVASSGAQVGFAANEHDAPCAIRFESSLGSVEQHEVAHTLETMMA